MTELTPSQKKAIEEIREVFPGDVGEIRSNGDGTVDFLIRGQVARVGKRGKYELRAEASNEAPAPETVVAAEPSAEDTAVQTSGEDEDSSNGLNQSGSVEAPVDLGVSSPVDVSDEGAGASDGLGVGHVGSPDRQGGEEPGLVGSSPIASVEPEPSPQTPAPEVVTPGVATEQTLPGSPMTEGESVPTFDQLPQVHRQEAFEALSLADERQVTAELEGRALSSMVYGFEVGGQKVFGLSWIGAREVVRAFNARTQSEIRISDQTPPVFEDVQVVTVVGWDEEANKPLKEERPAIRCTVYGMDATTGSGQWGTATVPRDQINKRGKRDGSYYATTPDGFAANKALSKAQRNALEPMVPRQFVEELIALFKGQDKVEYIRGTGRDVTPELPPALTDERAKKLAGECRELYGRFKKLVGPKSKTPAWFQQQLTASQHSHEALEDFRLALVDLVGQAEEFVKGGQDG